MAREKRKFEVDDGTTREAKHSMGGRATFVIPPGLGMFRAKKRDGDTHNLDVIAFQVTESHLRFRSELQYSKPGKWYGERTFHVHRNIGINDEAFTCLARTFGHACPVCEARAKLLEHPDPQSQDRGKALKTSERQLFLVYDHDDTEKGIQLWDVSNWNFGKHLDRFIGGARKNKRDAYRRYYHPTDGFTMRLTVSEESIAGGKNYLYTVNEFYERETDFPDEFWDHGYDLDAMIAEIDYDTLKRIYTGESEDVDDPPADETPRESVRGGARDDDDDPPPARSTKPSDNGTRDPEPASKSKPSPRDDGKPYIFAPGDTVALEWRGDEVQGEVTKVDIDGKVADVQIEGRERPIRMEFGDLTLVEAAKPPTLPLDSRRSRTPPPAPADDDDPRTATAGKRPAAGSKRPADDDEPTPPRKKR